MLIVKYKEKHAYTEKIKGNEVIVNYTAPLRSVEIHSSTYMEPGTVVIHVDNWRASESETLTIHPDAFDMLKRML